MLFNLLLASITILLCSFFLFLVSFHSSYIIPIVKENTKLNLPLSIPTGPPITLKKEEIDIFSLIAYKTIKTLSK